MASRECFAAADAALGRLSAPAAVRDAVAAFANRYVLRGRCPADDRLDEARAADDPPLIPYLDEIRLEEQ
jgi:glutamate--cysteine ligase